ncbi:MAG: acetyl-CoA carboxylase biotin carboxyl carrier protein subunit [Anaerolineales bacterium]
MKRYQIRVNDRDYQVEIMDMNARPIRVLVDGEAFEVWPQGALQHGAETTPPARVTPPVVETAPRAHVPQTSGVPSGSGRVVTSPLPGIVVAVHVQPGEEITVGQPLCVVEAMKMNNVIRASQAGKVAALRVAVGQHVKHHEVLVELV